MQKTRLIRLTEIQTLLQSKRLITARFIANKYGISMRTVYRDIQTLIQSGIPIVTEEGKGYRIMEGYSLPPVMFTQNEANALVIAEQLVVTNKDRSFIQEYQNAVTKIKAILDHHQKEQAELIANRIQIRVNQQQERSSNNLIHLQNAITQSLVIHIDYMAENQQISQRYIEPFALYNTQENWILIAHCQLRNELRSFRLDRIQQLNPTSTHFTPLNMTLQQYFEHCLATQQKKNAH